MRKSNYNQAFSTASFLLNSMLAIVVFLILLAINWNNNDGGADIVIVFVYFFYMAFHVSIIILFYALGRKNATSSFLGFLGGIFIVFLLFTIVDNYKKNINYPNEIISIPIDSLKRM